MRERSLIRYMGTKRGLADKVRDELVNARPDGLVVDLFSGMGAVATAVSPRAPVWLNDALSFPGVFAHARFGDAVRPAQRSVLGTLSGDYVRALHGLRGASADLLREEALAMRSRIELEDYLDGATHAANSTAAASLAIRAAEASGLAHYRLAALYFGAGYFSLDQAIQLDALRYAIDRQPRVISNWLLAAWLSAAGAVLNAPGHTAQYLRPNTEAAYVRMKRRWSRDLWNEFDYRLQVLTPLGSAAWRRQNRVTTDDALRLVPALASHRVRALYADPPYTKDHYSRFYHVYETLYRYDFPQATGSGRYRTDRYSSPFSVKSRVLEAFQALLSNVRDLSVPFVLSYPANGLLYTRADLTEVLRTFLPVRRIYEVPGRHSAMGGHGKATKPVLERIWVCGPA